LLSIAEVDEFGHLHLPDATIPVPRSCQQMTGSRIVLVLPLPQWLFRHRRNARNSNILFSPSMNGRNSSGMAKHHAHPVAEYPPSP